MRVHRGRLGPQLRFWETLPLSGHTERGAPETTRKGEAGDETGNKLEQ